VKPRQDNLLAMDVFDFAQRAQSLSGRVAFSELLRFTQGLLGQVGGEAGVLQWSARGEQDAQGRAFLCLHLQGAPLVQCQRCLTPFAWPVNGDVTLELVRDESELDDVQSEGEDDLDAPEKVLGSRRFDLLALIEDELILAVPTITRHPVCPDLPQALKQQAQAASGIETRRESPFAALATLKDKQ